VLTAPICRSRNLDKNSDRRTKPMRGTGDMVSKVWADPLKIAVELGSESLSDRVAVPRCTVAETQRAVDACVDPGLVNKKEARTFRWKLVRVGEEVVWRHVVPMVQIHAELVKHHQFTDYGLLNSLYGRISFESSSALATKRAGSRRLSSMICSMPAPERDRLTASWTGENQRVATSSALESDARCPIVLLTVVASSRSR
jgi:hypothetical protein